LRPDAAGSASERNALGKPTRRSPAFFAGAPFPVLAFGQTTVVPFPLLSEEREGKAQGLRHIHSPIRGVIQPWSSLQLNACVSAPRNIEHNRHSTDHDPADGAGGTPVS